MTETAGSPPTSARSQVDLESTAVLLERARRGDAEALGALAARCLPRLRRWASGRLPVWARDLSDTQDVVQESVFNALKRVDAFEVRGEGALHAYLRQAVLNRIRMEIRRVGRRPVADKLDPETAADAPSPLEIAVGRELVERYEHALLELKPEEQQAIIGRVEMGLSNEELAEALGKATPNAARMSVERALVRLAEKMGR